MKSKRLPEIPEIVANSQGRPIFKNTEGLGKQKREKWVRARFPAAEYAGVNLFASTGHDADIIANHSGIGWARLTHVDLVPHSTYISKVGYYQRVPGYYADLPGHSAPEMWLPNPDNEIVGNFLERSLTTKPSPEYPDSYLEALASNAFVVYVKQYHPEHWPDLRTFRRRPPREIPHLKADMLVP